MVTSITLATILPGMSSNQTD